MEGGVLWDEGEWLSLARAPTRDVLLVSAIITVSLSVTVVLCGLCHWCQRKLVRLLRAPGANGLRILASVRPPGWTTCPYRCTSRKFPLHTRPEFVRVLIPYFFLHSEPHILGHTFMDRPRSQSPHYTHACTRAHAPHLPHKEPQTHTR
ncbi:Hypothetical predicted protein [Marmota monax]|uniref:Uncharacterized protein n=1 Tax=Marmota monax TaxID=9995 RepID=A0A5E4AL63_MARMO|nr:hypothetical protein GHT09_001571 [Marmota monax]VTJ57429.1 Hypothetical predicted protein [Marmota monax]